MQEAQTRNNDELQRDAQWSRDDRDPGKQQMVEKIGTLHGEELAGSKNAIDGRADGTKAISGDPGDMSGKHAAEGSLASIQTVSGIPRDTSVEYDNWYEHACHIVEKPTPDDIQGVHPD